MPTPEFLNTISELQVYLVKPTCNLKTPKHNVMYTSTTVKPYVNLRIRTPSCQCPPVMFAMRFSIRLITGSILLMQGFCLSGVQILERFTVAAGKVYVVVVKGWAGLL